MLKFLQITALSAVAITALATAQAGEKAKALPWGEPDWSVAHGAHWSA